ncbi:Asp-tRNA(Asn)/Glu-tRNA(Gln) amidotransferase subunit GatC [Legionella waltersii]|uniref:Aspartyl/glutamyl-tRNA(Asn/Gln) amidotransferase subunit C n=1 Tax=Legionella waltersii TaxID=66969 RepID=A0A0W1AAR7_9GAMM|nr:Asp-tRNA(Asn)/Glu-tRNA(Gln) amidotransferase subunit GatC [Legionella waltersii]KTD78433.1 glutamyl/tRNA (Gln) amidotransferase subunit C [Legionella waltersii]SNV06063.1 glutamyl/tRNA (Gln) amidotransferase subunit C [Legionella waltersii]
MTLSALELQQIAKLAYLEEDPSHTEKLTEEISAIMDFVDQLKSVNTKDVSPLFHPLSLHQRLREDAITEKECIAELEALAPMFEDQMYLVPKVITTEK